MTAILNPKLTFVSLILVSILLNACSFSTRITSEPEGADVYVNNIYIGETPTTYKYRSGIPEISYLQVKKPGYVAIRNGTFEKAYRADVQLLWLIPGIVPYFVGTARYEDDYLFHLKKK